MAALAATVAALVNAVSALTPNIAWRHHALLRLEPLEVLRVSHALALPASAVLLVAAFYLRRRRRRALELALALLLALGVLNLVKGLDVEEAALSFVVAGLLWAGRGSFYVRHEPVTLRSAVWRVPLLVAGTILASAAAVVVASPWGTPLGLLARETADLLLWQDGPLVYRDEVARLDLAVGALSGLTLALCAYLLFRPLAAPRSLPDAEVRRAAAELVREHGFDTLAYFKLRRDEHYLFSPDGGAFLGYRVESGVLLVSGDPVGRESSVPWLLRELATFAERRGLRVGAIGVSERMRPWFERMGLRALYLGDEAVIETGRFSLEGRAVRKVRQSVSRLERASYRAELLGVEQLDDDAVADLERVSSAWLGGVPERGFAMCLDALRRGEQDDTVVVLARDGAGVARGFLHLVPAYGRPAMSLSFMRRDVGTPNGLTEFLVVRAIELLRARGIDEISLNFAAFARMIHSPRGRGERLLGRLMSLADAFFQIESLYRFNAKFFPRWEPRYLMHEGVLRLPRTGLAALWAEGQLPKPARPTWRRALQTVRSPRRERRSAT